MLRQRRPEPIEIARSQGDGSPPSGAAGRIGEPDELVTFGIGEQLDNRGEPLLARALRHGQLLDHLGLAPWGRRLGHGATVAPESALMCNGM
jgi:hypothetical protein